MKFKMMQVMIEKRKTVEKGGDFRNAQKSISPNMSRLNRLTIKMVNDMTRTYRILLDKITLPIDLKYRSNLSIK